VDYSSLFSTVCAGYECSSILRTDTSYYPCMRHCYLIHSGDGTLACDSGCVGGGGFEGSSGLALLLVMYLYLNNIYLSLSLSLSLSLFFFFVGVCDLPQCTHRTPGEDGLCRVGVDDVCFAYQSSSDDPISCVESCPLGTEEEHQEDGTPTGLYHYIISYV
jgi:hypothetical protein